MFKYFAGVFCLMQQSRKAFHTLFFLIRSSQEKRMSKLIIYIDINHAFEFNFVQVKSTRKYRILSFGREGIYRSIGRNFVLPYYDGEFAEVIVLQYGEMRSRWSNFTSLDDATRRHEAHIPLCLPILSRLVLGVLQTERGRESRTKLHGCMRVLTLWHLVPVRTSRRAYNSTPNPTSTRAK